MLDAWVQAGRSVLNIEFLAFWLATMALRTARVRATKWGKPASVIQLTGFPIGLAASLISHTSEAAAWGFVPLCIALIFWGLMIATFPASERTAIQSERKQRWESFIRRLR
jgi:hypothetical protein